MTPSRWLFLTSLAVVTGITFADAHAPSLAPYLCSALLMLALWRWRGRVGAVCWTLAVVGVVAFATRGDVPWVPPQPVWLVAARTAFVQALTLVMPNREAQLGAGMLLGVTDGIERDVHEVFRTAGVTHLVAVSGANLALVLSALTTSGILFRSRRAIVVATVVLAPTFALFTGAEPSILRAAAMAILGAAVVACGRRGSSLNLLVAASTCLLILDPTHLWGSVGYQLSVAATFGLVTLSQPFQRAAARVHLPGRTLLAPTLAATLTTMPIILATFGRASLVSLLANAVIGPLVPFVMVLVAVTGCLALIVPFAATLTAVAGWVLLRSVVWLATTAAHFPAASVMLPDAARTIATLGCVAVVLWLVHRYAPHSFA